VEESKLKLDDEDIEELDEEELMKRKEIEDEEREREKLEDLKKDDRMWNFVQMSEEEKDLHTCDEIFGLYLRDLSKLVNENYYKTALRFVLLYRECLNEYGWLKRRDHYQKAGMLDQDDLINQLKKEEEEQEAKEREIFKNLNRDKNEPKEKISKQEDKKETAD